MVKANKKEKLIKKREEKERRKNEKKEIINKHNEICLAMLDEGFISLIENVDIFNKKIENMTLNLSIDINNLKKYISNNSTEEIKEIIKEISVKVDDYIKEISEFITPIGFNNAFSPLDKTRKEVGKYLDNLDLTLKLNNNRNHQYIVSSLMNKVHNKYLEYINLIFEGFYDDNMYLMSFECTYYEFEEIVNEYKNKLIEENKEGGEDEEVIQISSINKINGGRLRVTHSEMISFAESKGYVADRQSSSTHKIFKNVETGLSIPIPSKKGKDLPQGTMSKILKQMGTTRKELAMFLGR